MAGLDFSKVMARIDAIGEGFGGKEAQVGFFPGPGYENGASVAYVATIQEMGCPEVGIPPRPFMRPTIVSEKDKWAREMGGFIKLSLEGKVKGDGVFDFIGNVAAEDIGKTIDKGNFKPLSKITLMLRKMRDENKGDSDWHMSGAKVAEAAARVAANEPGSDRTTPLDDSGLLRASLQYKVVDKS